MPPVHTTYQNTVKTLLMIGLLAAVLVACGPSTPEVEEIVATAVAESEERMIETLETVVEAVEAVEAMTELDVQRREDISESARGLIKAVCTSDYITMAVYTTAYWVVDYLQDGEVTREDLSLVFDEGIPIDENYTDVSRVCGVDDDGRWVLLEQPDHIVER